MKTSQRNKNCIQIKRDL